MKYTRRLVLLFAIIVIFKGHAVFAETNSTGYQKIGNFTANHNFTVSFSREVDRDSLYSIEVIDEQGKREGVHVYVNPSNSQQAVIEAPEQGYSQRYYTLSLPEDTVSVDGQSLKKPRIAWFIIGDSSNSKIFGKYASYDKAIGMLGIGDALNKLSYKYLHITPDDSYYLYSFGPGNKLSMNDFVNRATDSDKYWKACGYPIVYDDYKCVLTPRFFRAQFDGFNRMRPDAEPYEINLRTEDQKTYMSMPMDKLAFYFEKNPWGSRNLTKTEFVEKLNASPNSFVQYENADGAVNYYIDNINKKTFTGFYVNAPNKNESPFNTKHITLTNGNGETAHSFTAEMSNQTRYYQSVDYSRRPISKADFLIALYMGENYLSYETYMDPLLGSFEESFTLLDRSPITSGAFAGFIGGRKGVASLAVRIDGERTIQRFPMTDTSIYYNYLGASPVKVTRASFIKSFSGTAGTRVTYMLRDSVPTYFVWEPTTTVEKEVELITMGAYE